MEQDQQEVDMWKAEIDAIRRRIHGYQGEYQHLTAFYGSSSIRLWNSIEEDLNPHSVINLGFGGSSYYWCDHYFSKVFQGFRPKKIILYAGDNDLGSETPESQILGNIQKLLSRIREHGAEIAIAIISVKPSPDRFYLKNQIESLNQKIKSIIEERGGDFIDLYSEMLSSNGNYRPELFTDDMLHMNEKGYAIWKREMVFYLNSK